MNETIHPPGGREERPVDRGVPRQKDLPSLPKIKMIGQRGVVMRTRQRPAGGLPAEAKLLSRFERPEPDPGHDLPASQPEEIEQLPAEADGRPGSQNPDLPGDEH